MNFGININPLLLLDYYKTTHAEQYPKGLTKMASYFTPRMSRLEGEEHLIMFGLQGFIKTYLMEAFNDNFFKRPKEEVLAEYERLLTATLGKGAYGLEKIAALHDLGYLPLEIKAVPEGTRVPIKVPMLEVSNTHPDFVWLVNTIETNISCNLWHTMISANVGYKYRQIVNHYYDLSVEDNVPRRRALGDFSMRGQESTESAIKSSAAFCLSFVNTATVPAISYLEHLYNCDCTKEEVAFGAISTEHSVMCSNYAVDGDETVMIKRLLTEIYPKHNFSMVSDSYDYWRLVTELLPACEKEIMAHEGTLLVRGDSGDPVDIICGTSRNGGETPEEKGTVQCLWESFGGSVNSKGYKVLDSHIKAIYGDSITPQRAIAIYERLLEKGFACNNVVLGVGSFSMQCLQNEDGSFNPYTRDTFGIAIKATYAEQEENRIEIFKNPKTDTGNFKKSQKGLCYVYEKDGELTYIDGYGTSFKEEITAENQLKTVFKDGKMTKQYTLREIRDRLHRGDF
ncbi:nicotinate phosphoribosyltransferase [Cellulosilyticum sp. WCF-2]|uniref:nicotinate phosphoribosyltransferase n=1 Tax=Cellulosilyticum sp. WCF-2 TaxID=2497860 RepID=UPI000F8D3AC3|nr:nicotinate phosphoribosyltransferase [Cellulosilyticum sp. WCF-2]QEH68739.1 nicotinate phosphoribosyltransferase [Cellulosilyticum sp. WCF-2]